LAGREEKRERDFWETVKNWAAVAGIVATFISAVALWRDFQSSTAVAPSAPEPASASAPPQAAPRQAAKEAAAPQAPARLEQGKFILDQYETRNRLGSTSTGAGLFVPSEFRDFKAVADDTARLATPDGSAVIVFEEATIEGPATYPEILARIRQERALTYEFSKIDYEALRDRYLVMTGHDSNGDEFYECTVVFEDSGQIYFARFSIGYRNDAYDKAIEAYMFDSFVNSVGLRRGGK
jgi:hypothetical protein